MTGASYGRNKQSQEQALAGTSNDRSKLWQELAKTAVAVAGTSNHRNKLWQELAMTGACYGRNKRSQEQALAGTSNDRNKL